MRAPECLVFPDGAEWIVFAPASRLVLRTDARAAARFRNLPDGSPPAELPERTFAPTQISITVTNACAQCCVYCYGSPAHHNHAVLDLDFCRCGADLVAGHAAAADRPLSAVFHGVGEPTFDWPCFSGCVAAVEAAAARAGVPAHLDLCTGGQVEPWQAAHIASHFSRVQVSIDGPADIQNRQRPRRDGRDALVRPLALARTVRAAGKRVAVKATVTSASVERLDELVELVASELGPVRLDLGMMFAPPWVHAAEAAAPEWTDFVAGFGRALDRGAALGVEVGHPTISWQTLAAPPELPVATHFCLAPPDIVTAFFDIPREGAAPPRLGAYGRFDRARGEIVLDDARRRELERSQALPECMACGCRAACLGQGGVKGRMPSDVRPLGPVCQARLGVLKELLRRAVPQRDQEEVQP